LGTLNDLKGVDNYYNPALGAEHEHSVSPAKAGLNFVMGVIGTRNPIAGAIYSGLDQFYPEGWPGALENNERISDKNREILPDFHIYPTIKY
jgi:hypothetical protein